MVMLVTYLSIVVETEITVSDITKIASSRGKLQTSGVPQIQEVNVSAQLEGANPHRK